MTRQLEPSPRGGHAHEHESLDAHGHDHAPHDHDRDHGHEHGAGWLGWLRERLQFGHSHAGPQVDDAFEADERGIRALKVSLLLLGLTAAVQLVVTAVSGSAALLTDTLHNISDALTAVPLWVAFTLARRPANRRYTYGYGRAEDLAGVVIVVFIALSAVLAGYESIDKLLNPHVIDHAGWVAAAGVIGFLGNEAVALYRMRVGREIGSAALVADGQHARVDGLTSLAVVAGAAGVLLGFEQADPIAGIAITGVILMVLKDTARMMWYRLMDAVDPELVSRLEREAKVDGVEEVGEVRVRWVGHRLFTDVLILVDEDLSTRRSHAVAEEVRHALFHAEPQLDIIHVHVDPCGHSGDDGHALSGHHARRPVGTSRLNQR